MSTLQKKIVAILAICVMLMGGIVIVGQSSGSGLEEADSEIEMIQEDEKEQAAAAENKGQAELVFWYEDDSYREFFKTAAERYYEETGINVEVEYRDTIDYLGEIYDGTMKNTLFPDVYLISGDNLEEAYLYGLVAKNEQGISHAGISDKAREACTYQGKLLGYPLSFNTCVFIYQSGYFETAPSSLQSIIDYSDQNEPGEDVIYLLEWDVNDPFYDFPFISNSVTFEKTETEIMNVLYDEELYQKDLAFFEEILESFSVDATLVSENSIISNFLGGRTLCAIIDTDSLHRLRGYQYSLMEIPNLNEELDATSCTITNMLVVNDFSEDKEKAAAFAEFVTVEMSDKLYELTGHFSVTPSKEQDWIEETAHRAYESSVLVPDSQDAKDFWVGLEETISRYF